MNEAIALDEKDANAWHIRGWAYVRQRQWADAIANFDKAISLRADDSAQHNYRALTHWWLGNSDESLNDLRKLIEITKGKFIDSRLRRPREDRFNWKGIAEDWTAAMEQNPTEPLLLLGRAVCNWRSGNIDLSRADLSKALSLVPRFAEVQMVQEKVLEEAGARE